MKNKAQLARDAAAQAAREDPVKRAFESAQPRRNLERVARHGALVHRGFVQLPAEQRANVDTPRNRRNIQAGWRAAKLRAAITSSDREDARRYREDEVIGHFEYKKREA